MEPGEKSQKVRENSETMVDHFSRLPEGIIHRILSLLEPNEAVVTSLLSKKWYKWFSAFPYVETNWVYKEVSDDNPQRQRKNDFLHQVESCLQGRIQRLSQAGARIFRFEVNILFPDLNLLAPRMNRLVALALEGNVEELYLGFKFSDLYHFCAPSYDVPQSVFLHKTLTVLGLTSCKFELEGEHNELDIVQLPQLRIVNFYYVRIKGLRAVQCFENLAASFPSIKKLVMTCCLGLTSIRSVSVLPQLMCVSLRSVDELKVVDILSPNLQYFSLNPRFTGDANDPCELHLPASSALKVLILSRVRISVSLQKLISESSGVLEVLRLHHCSSLEKTSISVRHLKDLDVVKCVNLSINGIDDRPPSVNSTSHLQSSLCSFP